MEELLQLSIMSHCLCNHPPPPPSTQVTLARGPSGYGFSVHSSHPVYITAVDEGNAICDGVNVTILCCKGLPAHVAGVKANDVLIELEGIDVRNATGKQVVNIIRYNNPLLV